MSIILTPNTNTNTNTVARSLAACILLGGLLSAAAVMAQSQTGPVAATAPGVILSGTVDLAIRHVSNGTLGHSDTLVSGSNSTGKFVLRGQEDLGGGLSAGFFLDATVLADSGTAQFFNRRSTVSLSQAGLGELRLGRDWVPTHWAWSGIDPFTTLGVASANAFRSPFTSRALGQAFGSTAEAAAQNPTLRVNSVVEYFLPNGLGGVYGSLMVARGAEGSAGAGVTRGQGGRLGWAGSALNVGVAGFKTRNANGNEPFRDTVWALSYNFGVLRAGVGQRRWAFGSDRTVNSLIGVTVPTPLGDVKISRVRADQSGATAALDARDASLTGIGLVHSLSRRTAVYGHYARISNQGSAAFAIPGGPATSGVATAANYFGGQRSTGFEVGLRHDF